MLTLLGGVLGGIFGGAPHGVQAQMFAPELPQEARISDEAMSPSTSYQLRVGPATPDGGEVMALEGSRADRAWLLPSNQETTLQIFAPLRAQIASAGYRILYECDTELCGGFDFRYALDLIPEPQMHVDLGDFRYLAARRGNDYLALTVSRSSNSGFVHLTRLISHQIDAPDRTGPLAQPEASDPFADDSTLTRRLDIRGSAALDDLVFESGRATLAPGDYASLSALSDYLGAHPGLRIALVGHTDAVGALDGNIALSRQRAEAVRSTLIDQFALAPDRITAEGAGWLAPRASNQTDEGRRRNRRVEVVITSTPN